MCGAQVPAQSQTRQTELARPKIADCGRRGPSTDTSPKDLSSAFSPGCAPPAEGAPTTAIRIVEPSTTPRWPCRGLDLPAARRGSRRRLCPALLGAEEGSRRLPRSLPHHPSPSCRRRCGLAPLATTKGGTPGAPSPPRGSRVGSGLGAGPRVELQSPDWLV